MLGRDEIRQAFVVLDEELASVSVRASVFVVGGAAMAIAYDARRSTVDVDAVFVPAAQVREAAARAGERLGLAADWINDGAKAFMPGDDPEQTIVFEGEHLQVAAASPRYLLAMKMLASRVDRDADDIRLLYRLSGLSTVEDGLEVVERAYPAYAIPPRTRYLLEEMFPSRSRGLEAGRDDGGNEIGR